MWLIWEKIVEVEREREQWEQCDITISLSHSAVSDSLICLTSFTFSVTLIRKNKKHGDSDIFQVFWEMETLSDLRRFKHYGKWCSEYLLYKVRPKVKLTLSFFFTSLSLSHYGKTSPYYFVFIISSCFLLFIHMGLFFILLVFYTFTLWKIKRIILSNWDKCIYYAYNIYEKHILYIK